jgi:hypothetical protein
MRALKSLGLFFSVCGLLACDPEHPCDPGYKADHGVCLRENGGSGPEADGGSEDAGPAESYDNDDSAFGRTCEKQSDCGGKAPVCGAPMLPLCTAVNCMQGESQCPATWTCLDISNWERPDPSVKSICVQL